MVIPVVFLIVVPCIAAVIGLYQAWLTHVEHGYSAETAGSLMLLPWVPLLLGFSVFIALAAADVPGPLADAIAVGVGLSALGASVAAGLVGEVGFGELMGDERPWVANGLHVPMVLTTAAVVAALFLIGLGDLAFMTMQNVAAAAGVGAAAAGGAKFWGGEGFHIPRREVVAIGTAAAIFALLVIRFMGI